MSDYEYIRKLFMEVIRMLVGYMRVSTEEQNHIFAKRCSLKYGIDERNILQMLYLVLQKIVMD